MSTKDLAQAPDGIHFGELSEYDLWELPDHNIRIYLNPKAVDRVQDEILQAFHTAQRSVETGGILLGRLMSDKMRTVVIEDFRFVPCEHHNGPAYWLSDADTVEFERALSEAKSLSAGGMVVVGYFRSHTRDDLFLDTEDLALVQAYFANPSQVFLVVKPFGSGCVGGFFFWEGERIHSSSSYLEVPFGRPHPVLKDPKTSKPEASSDKKALEQAVESELAAELKLALKPAAAAAPAPKPAPVPPPAAPAERAGFAPSITAPPAAPQPVAVKRTPHWTFWMGVGALAAALIALVYTGGLGRQRAQAPMLALQIEKRSQDLLLTWNRNSDVVLNAGHGVLSIHDGSAQRDVELDPNQLRSGSVYYTPTTNNVQFRLEVFRKNGSSIGESIQVLGAQSSVPSVPVPEKQDKPAPAPAQTAKSAAPGGPAPAVSATAASQVAASAAGASKPRPAPPPLVFSMPAPSAPKPSLPEVSAPVIPADAIRVRLDELQPATPKPVPPKPVAEDKPAVAERPPAKPVTEPVRQAAAPPTPQVALPAAAPSMPAVTQTPEPPRVAAEPGRPSPNPPPRSASYVSPRPTRQVAPVVAQNVRALLTNPVQVEVKVDIDVTGKVTQAAVLRAQGALTSYLAAAATSAARMWRFEPAQDKGKPVPSETVLTFRFQR